MTKPPRDTSRSVAVPPHSIEAEQSVLGGLMLVGAAWDSVADRLSASDFYRREHQLIFRAISELAAESKPFDAVTLGEWFERNNETTSVGGAGYLAELANNTPSTANIVAYADIVRNRAIERQLLEATYRISGTVLNPEGRQTSEILDEAEQAVFAIAEASARGRQTIISAREGLKEAVQLLTERYERRGQLTGISTGFQDLDKLTSGLQAQDLIIVAGRPSMGKTAFALGLAESAAMRDRVPVLVFSLEMSAAQLWLRLLSSNARVDQSMMRTGDISEEQWPRVGHAARMLSAGKIYVDETPALSPVEVRARARRVMREHGLGLVIVDYLQLMQVPNAQENRATEIAEISRNLKALAKELNVPVVALSQLNRAVEQRNDKRPVMSDLRESGAIEQDADLILFLYRDEVYNKESPWKGTAEVIIGKQRNGPIDTVRLSFLSALTRFEDYTSSPDM